MSATTPAVVDSTTHEIDACVAGAVGAARALHALDLSGRATLLRQMGAALDDHGEALVKLAVQESGLTESRLIGELARTTFQLRFFADLVEEGEFLEATIDHADPDWPPAARPDLRRVNRPLGPVAVFAGSNFPFAFSVAGGDTASALGAGCPVIVKTHPGHPLLSAEVARVAKAAAGDLTDVLQIVHGYDAGPQLLCHPSIRAGAFTGSVAGGRALHDLAAARPDPIPFYGELGSLNPVVVTPSAARSRLPEIAEGFQASFTLGVGQFCTKPGLLVIPDGVDITTLARGLDGVPAAPMLSNRIADGYRARLADLGAQPDVEVLVAAPAGGPVAPSLLWTTVAGALRPGSTVLDECFGPSSVVVTYQDEPELMRLLMALPGQLTASVFCDSAPNEADRRLTGSLLDLLAERAGRVMINSWPTGVAVSWAMQHGGPYPATTSPTSTSVGAAAVSRFLRPVAYQSVPDPLLPPELQSNNPLALPRRVDGQRQPRPTKGDLR